MFRPGFTHAQEDHQRQLDRRAPAPFIRWIEPFGGMATGAGDDAAPGANHCLGPDEFIDGDIRQLDGYPLPYRPDRAVSPA